MIDQEQISTLVQIDAYLNQQLTRKEIDILWVKFLQNPEWFEYFEIELYLRSIIIKKTHG